MWRRFGILKLPQSKGTFVPRWVNLDCWHNSVLTHNRVQAATKFPPSWPWSAFHPNHISSLSCTPLSHSTPLWVLAQGPHPSGCPSSWMVPQPAMVVVVIVHTAPWWWWVCHDDGYISGQVAQGLDHQPYNMPCKILNKLLDVLSVRWVLFYGLCKPDWNQFPTYRTISCC